MDAAFELISLIEQLKTELPLIETGLVGPKASQLDDFQIEERPEEKENLETNSNIPDDESSKAERSLENHENLKTEHLNNQGQNQSLHSRSESIQAVRNTLTTVLGNLVVIRTRMAAETQAVNKKPHKCDNVNEEQLLMHTPTFQEETCAILEILPLLQREMEQIVQQVACSGDGSCPEITDVNAVRQKNHKPNNGEKQRKTNKNGQQHCWNCFENTHWKYDCPKLNRKTCRTCQGTGIWKPPHNSTDVSYSCPSCNGKGYYQPRPRPQPSAPQNPNNPNQVQVQNSQPF